MRHFAVEAANPSFCSNFESSESERTCLCLLQNEPQGQHGWMGSESNAVFEFRALCSWSCDDETTGLQQSEVATRPVALVHSSGFTFVSHRFAGLS